MMPLPNLAYTDPISGQTRTQEWANVAVHGLGVLLSVVATVVLVVYAARWERLAYRRGQRLWRDLVYFVSLLHVIPRYPRQGG